MTINNFNRILNVVFFAAVLAVLCLNCHTSKSHESGNNNTTSKHDKDGKDLDKGEKEKGHDKDNDGTIVDPSKTYAFGDVVPVPMGKAVMIGSEYLKVRLRKVADGRCPEGVSCITAGEATVSLQVIKELDMVTNVDLKAKGLCKKTDGSCGSSSSSQGFEFSLMSLDPYPGHDGKTSISQDQYIVNIVVDED